jgi:hypothetical protein
MIIRAKLGSTLIILLCAANCYSQISPPTRPVDIKAPVNQGGLVFMFKGATIDMLPQSTVRENIESSGEQNFYITPRSQSDSILAPSNPVLVFNRAYGSYGYITGEITFKFKGDANPMAFPAAQYSGFKRVGNLSVFSIQAQSLPDFASYMEQLALRDDLEWFEPVTRYVEIGVNRKGAQ